MMAYAAIDKEIASRVFLAVFVIRVDDSQLISGQLASGLEVDIVGVLFPHPSSTLDHRSTFAVSNECEPQTAAFSTARHHPANLQELSAIRCCTQR